MSEQAIEQLKYYRVEGSRRGAIVRASSVDDAIGKAMAAGVIMDGGPYGCNLRLWQALV